MSKQQTFEKYLKKWVELRDNDFKLICRKEVETDYIEHNEIGTIELWEVRSQLGVYIPQDIELIKKLHPEHFEKVQEEIEFDLRENELSKSEPEWEPESETV